MISKWQRQRCNIVETKRLKVTPRFGNIMIYFIWTKSSWLEKDLLNWKNLTVKLNIMIVAR